MKTYVLTLFFNCLYSLLTSLFVNHYYKVLISQTIMWGISTLIRNPTLVDVAWGLNHFLYGVLFYYEHIKLNNLVALCLLTIWFVRLSGFLLYNRIIKPYIDPRYEKLAESKNKTLYYFFQFQLQGVLCTFTSIPLYYAFQVSKYNFLNYFGFILCVTGVIGESLADYQLQQFKNTRTDSNSIFRGGLFKKARHPNLFFELVFWVGMAMIGVDFSCNCSAFTFLGPFLLWAIMNFLTIPLTSKHMLNKQNYREVMEQTNKFWPF